MMHSTLRKGLVVAALHVTIVATLGAKLLVDRAVRPRVWTHAAPVDPSLPIRGRYVRLRIEAERGEGVSDSLYAVRVSLTTREGRLIALPATNQSALVAHVVERRGNVVVELDEPLAYFIPERVADPSRRAPGEELWVEVTIPRAGAPRPIRLGVKKDGVLTPLKVN